MSEFNPDAFLAQAEAAPAQAPVTSNVEGFDPDQFLQDAEQEKYGSIGQQIKAGLEGVAQGVAGPLAPMAEKALGVKEEDILGRKAANPITHAIGETVGLGAGLLTGTGEAAVMTKAGELAAGAAGLGKIAEGARLGTRIGSEAIKQAAEMAVLSGGDEISKMVLHDPDASAESAIANMGLSAALGGAGGAIWAGAVSPLWKATMGPQVETGLNALARKMGGIEGIGPDAAGVIKNSGLELKPEIAAVVEGTPMAQRYGSNLSQKDTAIAGRSYQKALDETYEQAGNKALESLGKTKTDLENIADKDLYNQGTASGTDLHQELSELAKPVKEGYEKINDKFRRATVEQGHYLDASYKISQLAIDKGWAKAESDAQMNLVNKVLEKLPKQETAEDIKKFITNLSDAHPFGSETYQAAKEIKKVLTEMQENVVEDAIVKRGSRIEHMGAEGPGNAALRDRAKAELEGYRSLKGQYKDLMDTYDAFNEHLHVGRYHGPESFLSALKEKIGSNPEAIARALSGTNKADILKLMAEKAPKALESVRQAHLDEILRKSSKDGVLDVNKLVKEIGKLSPQVKGLAIPAESQSRIEAIHEVLNRLKDETHNYSNTARTLDKFTAHMPSPIAIVAGALGHAGGAVGAYLAQLGFNEALPAAQLAMLKFLGSKTAVSGPGFKAMVDTANMIIKNQVKITKTAANVLKPGAVAVASMPTQQDRDKLQKTLDKIQENPERLVAQGDDNGHLSHYMPEHTSAIAQRSSAMAQYLESIRPKPFKPGILDKEIPPSNADMARYRRAQDISLNPLVTMQHIKDGTLLMSDIKDLDAMYPKLRQQYSQELINNMSDLAAADGRIPYKTRMALSLFLGQELDASMRPQSIMSAQPQQQNASMQQPQMRAKHSTTPLNKVPGNYMTPSQQRQANKRD